MARQEPGDRDDVSSRQAVPRAFGRDRGPPARRAQEEASRSVDTRLWPLCPSLSGALIEVLGPGQFPHPAAAGPGVFSLALFWGRRGDIHRCCKTGGEPAMETKSAFAGSADQPSTQEFRLRDFSCWQARGTLGGRASPMGVPQVCLEALGCPSPLQDRPLSGPLEALA